MITEQEGIYIREILGPACLNKISERLVEKNITNQKGGKLSNPFLCMLLKEERRHDDAETEIRLMVEETVTAREEAKERLKDAYDRHEALKTQKS
ncbi:hypothetical protein JM79_3195 [Gramella sp. Hel_I_59]|uniref:hypothetical protein n=1 Tax=Gramella sp. Hel_I_59 TaxID=1249978 RepID=UPI0011546380|nr:hypothetical protein [Gramella sp. Hel_I_59]TQI72239.1 hypothetical protein JM79_3195 [Gramella sp. Hel_I_59]